MVYYNLPDKLEGNLAAVGTHRRNGVFHENQTAIVLASEINQTLHPLWFRSWFHFNQVGLTLPKPCVLDR